MSIRILVVLGNAFKKKQLSPRPLMQTRLDYAITEFNKGAYDKIILCGGKTQIYRKQVQPSEAEIMKNYLLLKGVSRKHIIKENLSHNTIGNIVFLKKILVKRGWTNANIITNKIFVKRVQFLVHRLFESKFNIRVSGCKNNMASDFRRWIRFSESFWLDYCYAYFFKGVKRGDHKVAELRLKNKEVFYPDDYRQDYAELKQKYFKLYSKKVK